MARMTIAEILLKTPHEDELKSHQIFRDDIDSAFEEARRMNDLLNGSLNLDIKVSMDIHVEDDDDENENETPG